MIIYNRRRTKFYETLIYETIKRIGPCTARELFFHFKKSIPRYTMVHLLRRLDKQGKIVKTTKTVKGQVQVVYSARSSTLSTGTSAFENVKIVQCPKCGHTWLRTSLQVKLLTCPRCRKKITIRRLKIHNTDPLLSLSLLQQVDRLNPGSSSPRVSVGGGVKQQGGRDMEKIYFGIRAPGTGKPVKVFWETGDWELFYATLKQTLAVFKSAKVEVYLVKEG